MAYAYCDELGRYWVFDEEGEPYAGPYETQDGAEEAHPEIE